MEIVVPLEGPVERRTLFVRREPGPRRALFWGNIESQTANDNGRARLAGLDKLGLLRQAPPNYSTITASG